METHEIEDERGRTVRYKGLRIIPDEATDRSHTVKEGERLDHLAHRYLEVPERYWRICDANRTLWPPDLVGEPGRTLDIPAS